MRPKTIWIRGLRLCLFLAGLVTIAACESVPAHDAEVAPRLVAELDEALLLSDEAGVSAIEIGVEVTEIDRVTEALLAETERLRPREEEISLRFKRPAPATSRRDPTEHDSFAAKLEVLEPARVERHRTRYQEQAPGADTDAEPSVFEESKDSGWEFAWTPFVWIPNLVGDIGVSGRQADVDISQTEFVDILLDAFDSLFYSHFELRRGDFYIAADLVGVGLEKELGDQFIDVDVNFDIVLAELWLGYRVLDVPLRENDETFRFAIDARVGGRLWYVFLEADPQILDDVSGSELWVDPVIGLLVHFRVSEAFTIELIGDIGGFGLSSDFTWGFLGRLAWNASSWFSLEAGWRIVDVDYEDGSGSSKFVWDVQLSGPFIGAKLRF